MKERENNIFRFKNFEVSHGNSSMKIGIDGVLVGAWGKVSYNSLNPTEKQRIRILDAGCGCGLIGLMAAQRNSFAEIIAIDVHPESITESEMNFSTYPGPNCFKTRLISIEEFAAVRENFNSFDFILSNPPFYSSGMATPETAREVARHQKSMSPSSLLEYSSILLKTGGRLSMISLAEEEMDLITKGKNFKMEIIRVCRVRSKTGASAHRVLLEFEKSTGNKFSDRKHIIENLIIREEGGEYSEDYKQLTKQFYLAF